MTSFTCRNVCVCVCVVLDYYYYILLFLLLKQQQQQLQQQQQKKKTEEAFPFWTHKAPPIEGHFLVPGGKRVSSPCLADCLPWASNSTSTTTTTTTTITTTITTTTTTTAITSNCHIQKAYSYWTELNRFNALVWRLIDLPRTRHTNERTRTRQNRTEDNEVANVCVFIYIYIYIYFCCEKPMCSSQHEIWFRIFQLNSIARVCCCGGCCHYSVYNTTTTH